MSFNVLLVCEDYRTDQYITKPLVRSMLDAVGKPHANIEVCMDPLIGGVEQALDPDLLKDVVRTHPQADLYVLTVDRDGVENRRERIRQREAESEEWTRDQQHLIGVQAHQEVEVWLLAAQDDVPPEWSWQSVRAEPHAKERYFQPYVSTQDLNPPLVAGGRRELGEAVGSNYVRVRQLCDEVQELEDRVAERVA